jgi:D-amino peptidase
VKVYISADIEGVTGVTHRDETDLKKPENIPARQQMTTEVAAACEGAKQAGATEIWVKDAHGTGRNLIAAGLPQNVRLIRGWSGHPLMMLEGLDDTFHAVLMVGYHPAAGSETSPLSHALALDITRITLNDRQASEFLIHAYAAATLGVPVAFVSGDKGLCDEVTQVNQYVGTVAVKQGIGDATVSIHPDLAVATIRDGVREALAGDLARCRVALPPRFSVQVQFRNHPKAHLYGFFPGALQKDSLTVQFESDDYFEVLRFLLFATWPET